jgi:hypothetical protein
MPAPEWVVEQWPGSATIIAVRSHGIREGKPQDETRYYVTSLRTGAKAVLRSVRQRCRSRTVGPGYEVCRCKKTPTAIGKTTAFRSWPRCSLAINALRLYGIWSSTEGIAALAHDIKDLLGWRKAMTESSSG